MMGQLRELVHNLAEKQMQDQWAMGSSGIGANGCAAQFGETKCLVRIDQKRDDSSVEREGGGKPPLAAM